ncbi:FecCD family ABC transporter permease [Prauserella cavernicola]|uniref:Iron chelate uptake ABC transporter family permease subunit n=1 Tax=Prauserella cavernicola TaxID=2800127 RepID=A0A934V7Y0_9PSEU|nr:iron chelate uptake ABC transporter family permease subunit [Prauserella cavernicola]MBK1787720.1 iron chelate uptake ABC transporter family permease subunit [Prauserella cavernicola]
MSTRTVRAAGLSARYATRPATASGLLALLLLALTGYALTVGELPISLGEALGMLAGEPGPSGVDYVFWTVRLPRVLTALLVGAALGVSGAILQSLSRNPLGSPDVLGFAGGAATGALVQILVLGGGALAVALSALAGAFVTAALVYLLAYRRGVPGHRLVLVGIGIGALLMSLNRYLLVSAEVDDAFRAAVWLTGSLLDRTWDHVTIGTIAVAVLVPVAVLLLRRLSLLELGDELSTGLGVPVGQTRLQLFAVSVGLAGAATAAAGPVAFVALAAPHLARRLLRSAGPSLVGSGLVGAVLLLGSDVAAQQLFPTGELPVGVATGVLGGVYLATLLGRHWSRRPAASG